MSDAHSDTDSAGLTDVPAQSPVWGWAAQDNPEPEPGAPEPVNWGNGWGGASPPGWVQGWGSPNGGGWNEGGAWGNNDDEAQENEVVEMQEEAVEWEEEGFISDAESQTGVEIDHLAWQAQVLSAQAIAVVLQSLAVPIDLEPDTEDWRARGKALHATLATIMCVSRMWHAVALAQHELWGILLAFCRTQHSWNTVLSHTNQAPVRLTFWPLLDRWDLKALIPRASAIYVDDSNSWSNWSEDLAGQELTSLQVLHIRPSMHDAPLRTALPTRITRAPLLRRLNSAFPLLLDAHLLEDVVLSGLEPYGACTMIKRQNGLVSLRVENAVDASTFDWSSALADACLVHLRSLTLHTSQPSSPMMPIGGHYVFAPLLLQVDATARILLCAPELRIMILRRLAPTDIRLMCAGLHELTKLELHDMRITRAELTNAPPMVLNRLATVELHGAVGRSFIELMRRLKTPMLESVAFTCAFPPALRPVGLQQALEILSTSLASLHAQHTFTNEQGAALLSIALESASRALWASGYGSVAAAADLLTLNSPELNDLRALRVAAESTYEAVQKAASAPPAAHPSILLRTTIMAIMSAAIGQGPTTMLHSLMLLRIDSNAAGVFVCIHRTSVRTSTGEVPGEGIRVYAPNGMDSMDGLESEWRSEDQCLALTLRGLEPLAQRVRVLCVVERGLDMFSELGERRADSSDDAKAVVAQFINVAELRIEVLCASPGVGLWEAVAVDGVFPGLECITVSLRDGVALDGARVMDWWLAMRSALKARGQQGQALVSLRILGFQSPSRDIMDSLEEYCDELSMG